MMNANIIGTVGRITEKEFTNSKGNGKVCSVTLLDRTGSIRLVLWNDQIEVLEGIKEGDTVNVSGFVKAGNYGPEIMMGKEGSVQLTDAKIPRPQITDLKDGHRTELRAAVTKLFESNIFYDICPKCGTSLKGATKCIAHGEVTPDYAMRLGGVIEDGTGNMRFITFKERAEKILGMKSNEAKNITIQNGIKELFKNANYGEYILSGRVRQNQNNELEFTVNGIRDVNYTEEV